MASESPNVHNTLAANRLDPNVSADGHMSASGQGVGGTSEGTIQREGIEHIKKNTDFPSSSGEPTSSSSLGNTAAVTEPPASNPSDDATGGIAPGNGGVSHSAYTDSPVENKTIIGSSLDTVKSYLGWGGEKEASGVTGEGSTHTPTTTSTTTDSHNNATSGGYTGAATAAAAGLGSSAAAGAAYLTGSRNAAGTAENLDQTRREQELASGTSTGTGYTGSGYTGSSSADGIPPTSTSERESSGSYLNTAGATGAGLGATAAAGTAELTGSKYAADSAHSLDSTRRDQENAAGTTTGTRLSDSTHHTTRSTEPSSRDTTMADSETSNVGSEKPTIGNTDTPAIASERTAADAETPTLGDKQTTETTDADQAGAGPGDVGETNKPPAAAAGHSGNIENKSAIPTAGGERLGERHWGESKVVPEVPKKVDSEGEKGVSSKDGQPTDQVRDNTARNAGGATGGPGHHSHSHGHDDSTTSSDPVEKEKLMDKIKDKLHIGGKKE